MPTVQIEGYMTIATVSFMYVWMCVCVGCGRGIWGKDGCLSNSTIFTISQLEGNTRCLLMEWSPSMNVVDSLILRNERIDQVLTNHWPEGFSYSPILSNESLSIDQALTSQIFRFPDSKNWIFEYWPAIDLTDFQFLDSKKWIFEYWHHELIPQF